MIAESVNACSALRTPQEATVSEQAHLLAHSQTDGSLTLNNLLHTVKLGLAYQRFQHLHPDDLLRCPGNLAAVTLPTIWAQSLLGGVTLLVVNHPTGVNRIRENISSRAPRCVQDGTGNEVVIGVALQEGLECRFNLGCF